MNLLISDYDGTIKPYEKNPNIIERETFKKNIKSINKFIEKGNIFAIATGRSTDSIKEEIKKYNINYNYLLTYNGRTILNNKNKIIFSNQINNSIINNLINKDIIKEIRKYNDFGYTKETENLVYIKLFLKHFRNLKQTLIELRKENPTTKIDYDYIYNSIIIRNSFNKRNGIEELLKEEKIIIPKEKIITVGDETNDIDMINEYNGYRMFLSNPKLLFVTNNVTTSIHKLIKKIK